MTRLRVSTALLVPSQAVDEFPVWSLDSRFLGANIGGKWFKLDTLKVQLRAATWHERRIGTVSTEPKLEPMKTEEVEAWTKQSHHGDTELTGESGLRVEMQHHDLSTSLVVFRGRRKSVIWTSGMENCGALSLSPTESYVAYICEMNGVFVMNLGQTLQKSGVR